ncbi:MAG: hypothetical protein CYPHOPRED_005576 [Cyphobasidiales sp. Tagirdzhanova-0007]|nr:MAG: hypothetical protein CYPHOPRED_005576 [Cyphobasidiales sp. Tagirdzhanova-0007]
MAMLSTITRSMRRCAEQARAVYKQAATTAQSPSHCRNILAQPSSSSTTLSLSLWTRSRTSSQTREGAKNGPTIISTNPLRPIRSTPICLSASANANASWYSTSSAASAVSTCPACSAPLPAASASSASSVLSHCPSCSAFLPPTPSVDFFQLFSLHPTFTIEKPLLKKRFLEWQGRVHPDRLPSSSDREKQLQYAGTWSALVNEAYKTLNSDSLRGEYLLGKRGIQIEEKDKMEDPGLLMEILEVREALADAQTEEQVADIREQNKQLTLDTLSSLKDVLEDGRSELDEDQAKNLLIRLRYQDNVENVCREWSPGKDIVIQH